MTRIAALLLALFAVCTLSTQTTAQEVKTDYASVMIIPFDPNLYFSDSDDQLSKHNNKNIKEIRTLFRYGLNMNVNVKILSQYNTRPLLTDTLQTAREDLNLIYRDISYFKDKSMPSEAMKKKAAAEEREKKFTLNKKDTESQAQVTSKLNHPILPRDYMNVKISQPQMLQYLQKKYGTDIFVFINQFELVTNYEHCLDRATNTFERDIKVHFSIFDATGKQLAGDVAIAHFSSNTNDLTEIMRNNFPVISEYLAGNMPNKTKPAEEQVTKEAVPVKEPVITKETPREVAPAEKAPAPVQKVEKNEEVMEFEEQP